MIRERGVVEVALLKQQQARRDSNPPKPARRRRGKREGCLGRQMPLCIYTGCSRYTNVYIYIRKRLYYIYIYPKPPLKDSSSKHNFLAAKDRLLLSCANQGVSQKKKSSVHAPAKLLVGLIRCPVEPQPVKALSPIRSLLLTNTRWL